MLPVSASDCGRTWIDKALTARVTGTLRLALTDRRQLNHAGGHCRRRVTVTVPGLAAASQVLLGTAGHSEINEAGSESRYYTERRQPCQSRRA